MLNYPVEKDGIRFYNYYFYQIEKPISIEAYNKADARVIMQNILPTLPEKYRESKIVGETIVIPLKGVSEKVVKGVKYIWVGQEKSRNGWLTEEQYRRAVAMSKRR
jgi:hypothetical protein